MNTNTGQIMPLEHVALEDLNSGLFVPVKRPLTVKEKADRQIKLYSPCACGSGKKFKFCCKKPA
jgi:uncharacterized protein YecA (UPF0149 family)